MPQFAKDWWASTALGFVALVSMGIVNYLHSQGIPVSESLPADINSILLFALSLFVGVPSVQKTIKGSDE